MREGIKKGAKGTGIVAALAAAGSVGYYSEQQNSEKQMKIHGNNEQVLVQKINEQRITIAELRKKCP